MFETFAQTVGVRLRAGLVAAYGPEVGADAAADAMAFAWERWDRVSEMDNPAGYLFRVGQTSAARGRRKQGFLPQPVSFEELLAVAESLEIVDEAAWLEVFPGTR